MNTIASNIMVSLCTNVFEVGDLVARLLPE